MSPCLPERSAVGLCPALGGDERVRTDDPLLAKQVLSQLSYTPIFTCGRIPIFLLRFLCKDPQN